MKAIKFGMSALAVLVAVGASFVSTEAKTSQANYDYVLAASPNTVFSNIPEATAPSITGCTGAATICARAYAVDHANEAEFAVPAENLLKN